jgi:hypothetical protein
MTFSGVFIENFSTNRVSGKNAELDGPEKQNRRFKKRAGNARSDNAAPTIEGSAERNDGKQIHISARKSLDV